MSQVRVSTISEEYGYWTEQRHPNDDQQYDSIQLPVFDQTTPITAQPRADPRQQQRRPMPINTTDWVSTPRQIINPTCGSHFLFGVKQLEIQQTVDLISLEGGVSSDETKFRVTVPRAETLFLATELSSYRIIGSSRGFIVELHDASGQVAFTFKKSRTWGCVPGFLHKMTVHGGDFLGSIEQDFTLISSKFTVYNPSREPLCLIYAPNTFCSCSYKEERFQVSSLDSCRPLASIILQWDIQLDDYVVTLTFPLDMDVNLKSLLLGAAFLMESLYFERITKSPAR